LTATSLDIMTAAAAAAGLRGLVLACVDARRGEVFASLHEVGPPGTVPLPRLAPGLFAPAALAAALGAFAGAAVHAVGDGALRYADTLGAVPGVDATIPGLGFPPPAALLELARAKWDAGEPPVHPETVVPLYMREADAKSNFARAARVVRA
jgi:tRNA A37 threonylcarbamoyladenosine modification protein TsaB